MFLQKLILKGIVWFQKISIPSPRKGLEFQGGGGFKGPGKIERQGEGGLLCQFILFFPDR